MNLLYIRKILTLVATLLIAIISLNYFVDPGAIYYRSGGNFPDMYAKSLLNSDNGLLWSSNTISDRELALGLSSHVETTDCVIIGSSNVMQIGTYGESRSLDATCNTILNLAVSGGEIADHLILTYLAIKNGSPKKIMNHQYFWYRWRPTKVWAVFTSVLLIFSILNLSNYSEFLYFQF